MSSAMYPVDQMNQKPAWRSPESDDKRSPFVEEPVSGLARLALSDNRPTLEMVRIGDLQVDHDYQRDQVSAAQIERIANAFDWELFFALGVNRRGNGSLWVFDGQHRLEAARKLHGVDQRVPAFVTHGLTATDEARLFYAMQTTRRSVSPLERFKAQLYREEPAALEIQAIAKRAGFTIEARSQAGANIQAVSRLERLYYPQLLHGNTGSVFGMNPIDFGAKWVGRERLAWVLDVAARAWRYQDQLTAVTLESLGLLWTTVERMPNGIDTERLADILRFRSPSGWEVRSKEQRTPVWVLIAESYNKGLRGAKRMPVKATEAGDAK